MSGSQCGLFLGVQGSIDICTRSTTIPAQRFKDVLKNINSSNPFQQQYEFVS